MRQRHGGGVGRACGQRRRRSAALAASNEEAKNRGIDEAWQHRRRQWQWRKIFSGKCLIERNHSVSGVTSRRGYMLARLAAAWRNIVARSRLYRQRAALGNACAAGCACYLRLVARSAAHQPRHACVSIFCRRRRRFRVRRQASDRGENAAYRQQRIKAASSP